MIDKSRFIYYFVSSCSGSADSREFIYNERKLTMGTMLSKALREFMNGPHNQLLVNMGGKDGKKWQDEFLKFNRMEPCWSASPNGIPAPDDNVIKTMDAVARLSAKGYLDTSFDSRAVHPLVIRPLSKEQAFAKYRKSDGKPQVRPRIENPMPYQIPRAQLLLVMHMQFGRGIESDDALGEMDELGVQPFFGEWIIQYGCVYPDHQKENPLVALGTKFDLVGLPHAPYLWFGGGVRVLSALRWGGDWGDWCRFPVVRKGLML